MCTYVNKLREYLDHDPIQYAEGDSLLDELYWCYTESNFNTNPELREQFQKLYRSMPELSESRFDKIFSLVNALTAKQDQATFRIGAKIGFRLAAELFEY